MPLFLQALPLSLKTLWRYLLLLPFLTALTIAATLAAAFLPIIGLIVPGVMSILCTLAGLRCALNARGHDSDLDIGKLVKASFWYFVLGIVAGLIFAVFAAGLGQVSALAGGADEGAGAVSILGVGTLLLGVGALALMCALAVPMTAAAATATIRGRQSDLFWGFGAGLVSLAVVAALGIVLNAATFFLFHQAIGLFVILQSDVSELATLFRSLPNLEIVIPVTIASIVFSVWTTCWFFATAVLAWEREKRNQVAQLRQAPQVPRMSTEDLRALREARSQGQRPGL